MGWAKLDQGEYSPQRSEGEFPCADGCPALEANEFYDQKLLHLVVVAIFGIFFEVVILLGAPITVIRGFVTFLVLLPILEVFPVILVWWHDSSIPAGDLLRYGGHPSNLVWAVSGLPHQEDQTNQGERTPPGVLSHEYVNHTAGPPRMSRRSN